MFTSGAERGEGGGGGAEGGNGEERRIVEEIEEIKRYEVCQAWCALILKCHFGVCRGTERSRGGRCER